MDINWLEMIGFQSYVILCYGEKQEEFSGHESAHRATCYIPAACYILRHYV